MGSLQQRPFNPGGGTRSAHRRLVFAHWPWRRALRACNCCLALARQCKSSRDLVEFASIALSKGANGMAILDTTTQSAFDMRRHLEEMRVACGSAAEWMERMQPIYFSDETTTDRDKEKVQQVIDWLNALCRS
jgi:hypothetical protein